jgi:hypothetical protein
MKKSIYFFKTLFLAVLFSSSISLMAQVPDIELQQPTGGEEWTGGGTYLISWLDNFNGKVDALYKHVYDDPCDNFAKTANTYTFNDLITELQGELGTEYTLADWNDIVEMNSSDQNSLFACMMTNNLQLWITKDGEEFTTSGRHYAVKYTDVDPGGIWVNLDGTDLYWGSIASNTAEKRILAKHIDSDYIRITGVNGTSGTTCYWHTNNLPLGEYRIKVRSHNVPDNDDYADESGIFTLVDQEEGFITLIQPEGGEVWPMGTRQKISWTDNLNEPVLIEYSRDGTNWITIKASASGSTYNWPIRDTMPAATTYKVRISSTVPGSTTGPATSGKFSVTASNGTFVDVLQPDDNTIMWARGTKHLISWNDDLVEKVNVYYVNQTTGYQGLIKENANGTTRLWNIPDSLVPGNYKILVKSSTGTIQNLGKKFKISISSGGNVEVLQPDDSSISWARGTKHLVSWNDEFTEKVNVYYENQLTGYVGVIKLNAVGTTRIWNIPDTLEPGKYRVLVKSSLDETLDDEGKWFHITMSAGTDVTIIQPSVNGIQWQNETEHLISWTDDFDERVNIELWSADESTFIVDIATNVWGSTRTWDIPDNTIVPPGDYKVKVYSKLDPNIADFSDKKFEIVGTVGTFIDILQPEGGEVWQANQAYYISWLDDFLEGVDIELYENGAEMNPPEILVSNRLGSTWVWDIPLGFSPSDDYSIYIENVNDTTLNEESNQFSVIPYVMLNAYPNPASNMLILEVTGPNEQPYQVTMYDRFNTQVYNASVSSGGMNQLNISTQELPNGVYFLNVTSNTYNASRKIIVNHR